MARNMKDSGIEWIGEIPEGWEVSQLKYATRWKSEKGCPDAPVLSLYRDFGVVPKDSRDDNHNVTSLDTSNYKVVDIGDLVINKMKAWQGSMAVSDYRGIVSPAYHVCSITSNKVNKRYLHHLLRNPAYLPEYSRLSTGMRIGQWDLGFDDFKNIPFLIPPLDEQAKIADYLDNGCASLDAMLSKTRSSIEEYKKLKQAVITQAVTKGVRGEREMKDSGVEWIGEIPAEWSVQRIKTIFSIRNERNYLPLEQVNLISLYTDKGVVQHCDIEKTTGNKASNADGYKKVYSNDMIVNIILCWMGAIGRSNYAGVTSPAYDVYVPSSKIECKFYHYYFRTLGFSGDCYKNGRGIMAMRWRTYSDQFRSIKVVVPPLEEQKEIVGYLDAKCAEIDGLIAKKEQLVKELESYKKSLIYEVVTGKREV